MIDAFPSDRKLKRKALLDAVDKIAPVLRASGAKSEELGTLAPDAVAALRTAGIFKLKLCTDMGGAEADPVTEMMVLEQLAYNDLTSGWCTMVGATAVASLGTFLPQSGLDKVFANGHVPTAAISFFPAGRAVREGSGFRVRGRWRFNSGIRHAEWVLGGTVVEGTEAENGGRPIVMFSAFPIKDVIIHDNWGGVVGLRGTGSLRFLGRRLCPARGPDICLGSFGAQAAPRRPVISVSAVQLCRQGTRQHCHRCCTARARRTDQPCDHDPRHVPLLAARRTPSGASFYCRGRSEITGGARPDA